VQVRFNPARVGSYRLIGFEQHRLREEDFRNDQVDAAELADDEAAVALYQVEVLPDGEGELGEVFVRFRDPSSHDMVERSWPILHEANPRAFDRASASIQLAGTAALLAESLRGGEWADAVNLDELAPVASALRGHYAHQGQVQQLIAMFEQMRRRSSR
jgi:Ca-activated chloride channel homolog